MYYQDKLMFFIFAEKNNNVLLIFHYKHTYLHLYSTRTTMPQGSIYTPQGPRYPRDAFILHKDYDAPGQHYKHTYLYLYSTRTTIPQGSIYTPQGLRWPRETLQFFTDIPGAIWTIQHLPYTLAFKDHQPHVLHDLAERRSQIPRTPLATCSTWLSGKTFNFYYDL